MGRWQRPHHRHPFQDRRGGPGRHSRHHSRRHGRAFRHAAGWGGQWREGVRVVGVADRPAGENDRQGRGVGRLEHFSGHSGRVGMAQNGAPTHEIERQGRWKQGGGMVGRYTRGESAGSALRYL